MKSSYLSVPCSHTNAIHSWLNEWTNVWMETWRRKKNRQTPALSSALTFCPHILGYHVSTNMRQILHVSFFLLLVDRKKLYKYRENQDSKAQHSTKINPSITHTHILKYLSCFSWPDATCCDECFAVVAHLNAIWEKRLTASVKRSDTAKAKAVCYWSVDLFIGSHHITSHYSYVSVHGAMCLLKVYSPLAPLQHFTFLCSRLVCTIVWW